MNDDLRSVVIDILEASAEAQLHAVRRLRQASLPKRIAKRLSQVDMAFDVLQKEGSPLHVSTILERIELSFGVVVDRESLVSSLTKKIAHGDRFTRVDKNTFGLLPESKLPD
jgi:hypothetical protein